MQWYQQSFSQLDTNTLFEIMKLRVDVFVVEQCCYYPELDQHDRDPATIHLYAYQEQQLVAYLRCLAPDAVYSGQSAMGRVLIAKPFRNQGIGHQLIKTGIEICEQQWPQLPIKISAQTYLQDCYRQHGFETKGQAYLEDGIEHIDMVRPC